MQENADSNYTIASANKIHTGLYTCAATVNASGLGQYSDVYSVDVKVRCKLPSFIVSRTSVFHQFAKFQLLSLAGTLINGQYALCTVFFFFFFYKLKLKYP